MTSKCGTYGGYQAHRKRGEDACGDCADAANAYVREYRDRKPETVGRHNRPRALAVTRLTERYPGVYRKLLAEARAEVAAEFDRVYPA